MPEVDPNRRGDGDADETLPPGEYLLAMTWFDHKQGNRGPYLRACFTVIAGPMKGRKFFSNMGVDATRHGTHNRWQIYAEHVGCTDRFDTEKSGDIAKHFKGRGFKGRVKREHRQGRTYNDLEQFVYKRLLSEEENAIVAEWWTNWSARKNEAPSRGGDPGPQDGDAPWEHPDADIPF